MQSIVVKNKLSTHKNQKRGADACQWKIHLRCVMLLYLRARGCRRARAGERVGGWNWSEKSLPHALTLGLYFTYRTQLKGVCSDRWVQTHTDTHIHTQRLCKWLCNGVTRAVCRGKQQRSPRKWEIATNFDGVAELCMVRFSSKQILVLHVREKPLDWFALFERDGSITSL